MDRQLFVDRLLETENLTDRLEDPDADYLLKWGLANIDGLINGVPDEAEAGDRINRLMHVMRALNSAAGGSPGVRRDALVDLLDRFGQMTGEGMHVAETEYRSVAERVSKMNSHEALVYLTEWLDGKRL
ncbi:MAG TPA: hypothetical protein VLZ89_14020 [Anaerolineales bacterium]|nr:hypothetical protein [Anaerolineales bacterium]